VGRASSDGRCGGWVTPAGGAYVPAFFAGMYAPLRCARAKKRHVCWSPDPVQRGAYITTKGVVTYAPMVGTLTCHRTNRRPTP
jgi:hypothetical protein